MPAGPSSPPPFDSDYFGGSYTWEDLGWQGGDDYEEDEGGQGERQMGQHGDDSDSDDSDDEGNIDRGFDREWEPDHSADRQPSPMQQSPSPKQVEESLSRAPTFVEHFKGDMAGRPIDRDEDTSDLVYDGGYMGMKKALDSTDPSNPWAPFTSKIDWEFAQWAKLTSMCSIPEKLGLSFKNSRELNKIVDKHLPGRPRFKHEQIVIGGEAFDIYFRDILECIRALYGDPEFAPYLVFKPERHYADEDCTIRLYHDMHTGKWWWATQKVLEATQPGATIIPVVISSDKTQLTLFRNRTAYPILLAYLPTTKLDHMKNKAARCRALANLFHGCMKRILSPLKDAGTSGVHMASGDGAVRRCHPIFATFIGDYPEQLLVACCKNGECPSCVAPNQELGANKSFPWRDLDAIQAALTLADGPDTAAFNRACVDAGIKPIYHPFWEDLPYVNIYRSIAVDVLHQLYQGIVKHLLKWLAEAFGADELDARCRRLPPNHNIKIFSKGITSLSRYPAHTSDTLQSLEESLDEFHANKAIFVDLGIRSHFNFPKLHACCHYIDCIKMFGTTDNYNTETSERLHIDFTKDAYHASNRKDEYLQMTLWVERKEKVLKHRLFVQWRLGGHNPVIRHVGPIHHPRIKMTRHPSAKSVPFARLIRDYGAMDVETALCRFIAKHREPTLHVSSIASRASAVILPFRAVPVYHKIKFWHENPQDPAADDVFDVVHCRPQRNDKYGRLIPGRFDMVLVKVANSVRLGVAGYRVAQVRAVFRLPPKVSQAMFPSHITPPEHLAYVEWFTPFKSTPEPNHRMYQISRSVKDGKRVSAVVAVEDIQSSVHLYPLFGPVLCRAWSSDDVLEECTRFYVNCFKDPYTHITLY
ncbi:hypothetical protein JAAARDRAFT_201038 [Jaapia argillacea MUCL 33604]|uniref:Uncharacterized protein n=1 Tax=Jaapia argillacea MUCL 33604 TaxID=933084 RepID=A0A067PDZ3_9AGAM|nr:hypothetical protein JAAARDRAFT_201038 [Jaapia argillacea MUCL 33604]